MKQVDLDYYGTPYTFNIENEDQWNGLENDWQKRKFLVDKLVELGKVDKPDGAFDYSVDQAQRMFSKGIEVFGRASGVEAIEEFGRENAEAQVQDMQAGRYEPFYTKSLRETYNEDGLFSALDWVREKSIENSASSAAGIGGALATAGASFISAPAAVVAGIATLAATITQGTGETALEMEEKTGDYNSLLAIGSGTLIGILDRFGAGKVINKDDLAKMTVEQLTNKLRKEGFNEAAESILKSTTKRITKSVGSEAVTEGAQNLISQGATALAGGEYTGQEVLDSTLESAVLGGTMGGAVTGTVSTVANTPNIASSISDTTKRFANFRSTNAFEDNPRLASSDARVSDMFDEEKSKINATKQGTDVAEDVVFKNIQDRLKNNFKAVSDALFNANKITGGERKVFNQIVSRAAKHNRALTAPIDETTQADFNEDITGGFESDQEFINDLDLDQADKDLLLDALLDLETVTEAGMKNRAVGTFREMARRFGVTVGASAGATLGGGVGAAVGASAGQRTLESIGQSIDKLFGLNRPKVLKRGEARRKAADFIGRDYGNTPRDLSDLIQRLIEQQVTVNTKQDKDGIAPERQALVDFLNEVGAPRAGGWLETVRQSVQAALDGTGVAVSQEDVLAAIAEVQRLGYLDESVADDLLLNRGGQITIPKLILDISDATLKFVRDREGIAPNPQSEAKANTATQEAQTRREANIQQGIEDNRRVLDASKAELDADKKIPKADKAKLSEALRNMRLDLGRNPVEAIQNIVKDLRKSGVDEASIQAYILPYATRVAQQQQQNDVAFSQVDPIPEVETAPASNPNRVSPSRPGGVNRVVDPMQEDRQIGLAAIEEDPKVYDKIENKISKYVGLKDPTIPGLIEHAIDNLRYLYNSVSPEYRERARQWYVGANKLTQTLADQYGLTLEAVAGVMASLSPQKDWYMNYDLGVRTVEIVMNQQDTVFDADMRQAFVDMIENKDAKRSAKSKKELYEALKKVEGKRLGDINPNYKGHFVRFYDAVYNPEKGHRVVTPEGTLIDFVMTQKGEKSGTAWNAFRDINKAVNIIENSSRENINEQLGEKHKVRSFYNNILDPYSPQGDVTIDTHAVAAALLRPLSGKSIEVLENFKDAGTSKNLGVFGSYGVYAEAYRRLAEELGIQPRELQSITWEAVRGLFSPSFKGQDENVDAINSIWQRYSDGDISIDQARSEIDEKAGGIDRAQWEDTGTQSGNAKRPNNANDVGAGNQTQSGILSQSRVYGSGSDGGVTSEPAGLLSRPTEEVNQQQEFDFDVQGIPYRPTTDGQAAREIKENLEEAEGLIEFGKPGSPFENGIKNYKQLNAVLTAIGLADKLFIVPSQAEMKRVAEKLGGKLPSDTTGLMGFAVQNRETGKTKGIVVLQQGKGGKKVPQDAEFATAVHETAHAIEFSSLVNFNFVRQTAVSRPYSVTTQTIQESSLRDILNDYLTSLGRDRRDFDNDPIVKEIREIQTNESITAPAGQSGRMRPNYNIEAYMDGYDKARAIADAEGKTIRIDREGYRAEALDKLRRRGENYYETAAEFTVDPLLFMMAEPKIAKEKYPNIYKFIQDVMNGEDPTGISDNLKKDGKLKFYTAPFSVILAAVLSAMGMAEDEEELPPVSPPNRGALRPQPGALSI